MRLAVFGDDFHCEVLGDEEPEDGTVFFGEIGCGLSGGDVKLDFNRSAETNGVQSWYGTMDEAWERRGGSLGL